MTAVSSQQSRYHPTIIALHWGVLLLMIGVYASMELRGYWPRGSNLREGLKLVHYSLGLTVFALVIARIVIRLRTTTPAVTPPLSPLLKLGATGAHLALYAFMIAMPLLGWATLSAEGKSIIFFGIPIFPIAPVSETLTEFFEETHELIGDIGYFLIGAHAAAALYHHYIRRDDTLTRMLPDPRKGANPPL
ncbi:MAG: cytochrome b [Alphaproteobacteria bacterium]|nr:cytochrome b [Alphaproteobacteria bacterium]